MSATEQHQPTFQFGAFELDSQTGELRKHGVKLKLQQQPVQILALLLEHPGAIVTREEIQKRLWPENTYVDFDNAINSAIRKLREALNDSPGSPRYIETLSRRGYRFIAPVIGGAYASHPVQERAPGEPHVAAHAPATKSRRIWWIASALAAVLIATGIALTLRMKNTGSIGSESPLPAVPLTGNPGDEAFPAVSPEGSRVAYSWRRPQQPHPAIYVKLIGPGGPVRLTPGSDSDFAPAWSPDGRYLAFLRTRDAMNGTVVIIPSVGGPERELATVTFNDSVGRYWELSALRPPLLAWSPDAKWLLSVDYRTPGITASIVRVSVETGEKRPVTFPGTDTHGDTAIVLSPDGTRLAFIRNLGAFAREVYALPLTMDMLPKGEPRRLTFDRKQIESLAWAADGRSLVFSSTRGGRLDLWRLPIAPSGPPVRVTAAGDAPKDLAVSREGHHLVYSHQFIDWDIWRAPLNGKPGSQPTSFISSTRLDFHPKYSPDGKRIAFESNRSGSEEIWIADADGSNLVQLTTFRNLWAGSPRWSPDGQKIAFDGDAAGTWNIYLIGAQGGTPLRLTPNEGDSLRPSWSHDGKWVYFSSTRTGRPQVWKVPSIGGTPVQVTKNGGAIAFESPDGKDLYYTKLEPGLWKMPVRGGPETKILNSIAQSNFAPMPQGLYFLDYLDYSSPFDSAPHVKVLDYETHAIRTVASLPPLLGLAADEMSISPDGQFMLFSKSSREGSELMLIENFR